MYSAGEQMRAGAQLGCLLSPELKLSQLSYSKYIPCFQCAKTCPKRTFSMTENERFGLVFRENWVYKFGHWSFLGIHVWQLHKAKGKLICSIHRYM
jgi:hypothetical protein